MGITGVQQRPPYRDHPGMPAERHPPNRPADQEWPHSHEQQQGSQVAPRRLEQQWSPGREHDWPPSDHHGHSPQQGKWYREEGAMLAHREGPYNKEVPLLEGPHDPRDGDKGRGDTDASVHEAVAQLAEQMKSVRGLASKLNLPNSPKTAKEWQEVAKMVAAAAAVGSNNKEQLAEQGEDDTQRRVAAMLANDSDSDSENPTEVKRSSPAREFDGTYAIPPEFREPVRDESPRYSMDYGHGEPQFNRRPYDYPPDDHHRQGYPPSHWDDREREHFTPDQHRPFHRPLSPPLHRHHVPPDYKGFPPPHSRHPLAPSDWYDRGRPRSPPYPQYGPPLPHDIPTSMLDEMTSDQQLLLAAAVNSGSGKNYV